MRVKRIAWSGEAKRFYLPLLRGQRLAIDELLRALANTEAPPKPAFRNLEDFPDYWFARTEGDVVIVVQRRGEDYYVAELGRWTDLSLRIPEEVLEMPEAAPSEPPAPTRPGLRGS